MTQFTLKFVEDQDNPVIILDSFHNATALIDTGAKIPVWLEDEKDIQAAGGILKQSNIRIRGLSQKVSTGNLYTLSKFQIGKIIYTKLDIVVLPDKNTTYNILLSATMFRGMIYCYMQIRRALKRNNLLDAGNKKANPESKRQCPLVFGLMSPLTIHFLISINQPSIKSP